MNVKDLMIGDWVEVTYNHRKIKVNGVFVNAIDTTNGISPLMGDEIIPIPLLGQIAECNGFEKMVLASDVTLWKKRIDEESTVTTIELYFHVVGEMVVNIIKSRKEAVNKNLYHSCDIRNVHELQHALRLCGLNGLADNLKVE